MKNIQTSINAGWVNKPLPSEKLDNDYWAIYNFYVLYTPCEGPSYKWIPITRYGWSKKVWSQPALKDNLYAIADLKKGSTLCFAKKLEDIRDACRITIMGEGFHKDREIEKIAVYKGNDNEVLCIFRHIRNSFAHGRFMIYENNNKETVYVIEDGIKKNGKLQVRARMILKKSTLLQWIEIITRRNE